MSQVTGRRGAGRWPVVKQADAHESPIKTGGPDGGTDAEDVAVGVRGDSFVAERPRVWAANVRFTADGFDLTPDGKRVAMFVPLATTGAAQRANTVVFVLNFFDELRRRVP